MLVFYFQVIKKRLVERGDGDNFHESNWTSVPKMGVVVFPDDFELSFFFK